DALAGYAGDYTLMPGFVLTLRVREGGLSAQATGQGEFALEAAGPDRFEARAHGIAIVFKRGADGAVESLELHQGGNVLTGAREEVAAKGGSAQRGQERRRIAVGVDRRDAQQPRQQ